MDSMINIVSIIVTVQFIIFVLLLLTVVFSIRDKFQSVVELYDN